MSLRFSQRAGAAAEQGNRLIQLHGVGKDYSTPAGAFRALVEIELALGAGEFVALVGKSGSGKSTLLNLVGGIDRPSSGSVMVGGSVLERLSETQLAAWRARHVGFVFQSFQLLPTLTAAENVMLPMDFARVLPPRARRPRALALLERVDVAEQADKLPTALSGGQQQRVAIARALANDPAVLLADEPTGNLDTDTARAVLELFRAAASAGTTVLIATHERDLAGVIDRRLELSDGRLLSEEALRARAEAAR